MPVIVTVTNDAVPVVSLTTPPAGATYLAPATISLSADASEPRGSIAKVEFFANGTVVGVATTPPNRSTWFSAPPGSYAVAAKATDNLGKSTISSSINVIVLNNVTSTVILTAPQAGAQFAQGQPIVLTASGDPAGVVPQLGEGGGGRAVERGPCQRASMAIDDVERRQPRRDRHPGDVGRRGTILGSRQNASSSTAARQIVRQVTSPAHSVSHSTASPTLASHLPPTTWAVGVGACVSRDTRHARAASQADVSASPSDDGAPQASDEEMPRQASSVSSRTVCESVFARSASRSAAPTLGAEPTGRYGCVVVGSTQSRGAATGGGPDGAASEQAGRAARSPVRQSRARPIGRA